MWVTAYCDASFKPGQGGAWAVWLASCEGRVIKRGACPDYVSDSTSAELAAMYVAVYLACRTWPGRVRGIVLRSDCQGALELASPTARPARREGLRRLQALLTGVLRERSVTLETQWVRGHQPLANGTQAYLNRACDKLANKTRKLKADAEARPRKKRRKRRGRGRKSA